MLHIGITMGCPVGIGPEIILKYFDKESANKNFAPVVVGDPGVLDRCRRKLNVGRPTVVWRPGTPIPTDAIPVVPVSALPSEELEWGQPDGRTGKAMAEYISTSVALIQKGFLDGMATCPISKKALQEADYPFPGHTEMLAHLTKGPAPVMMMAGGKLRVTLVTIHCALSAVPTLINRTSVLNLIRITHKALAVDFALEKPRIAVAGLNPHAGEQGLFGKEEERYISPAIDDARHEGIDAVGPFPPDTVFYKAAAGNYDVVVCMYHDQGLIPFKLLHFDDGVNVTLGLPIVRTSVDHGTAYDIAGKGIASETSLTAAVKLAATIARNRSLHGALSATDTSFNLRNES